MSATSNEDVTSYVRDPPLGLILPRSQAAIEEKSGEISSKGTFVTHVSLVRHPSILSGVYDGFMEN